MNICFFPLETDNYFIKHANNLIKCLWFTTLICSCIKSFVLKLLLSYKKRLLLKMFTNVYTKNRCVCFFHGNESVQLLWNELSSVKLVYNKLVNLIIVLKKKKKYSTINKIFEDKIIFKINKNTNLAWFIQLRKY